MIKEKNWELMEAVTVLRKEPLFIKRTCTIRDGVVKTLHLLRHCKLNVITTYLSTPHSIKFAFLEYEVFYLAIQSFTFTTPSNLTIRTLYESILATIFYLMQGEPI